MILGMLEYLSQLKSLFPYYPLVELLVLQEENAHLLHYQVAARHLVEGVNRNNDIVDLPYETHMALINDPTICDSWSLLELYKSISSTQDQALILQRMRTWKDFDPMVLYDTVTRDKREKETWYAPLRALYHERVIKPQLLAQRNPAIVPNTHGL